MDEWPLVFCDRLAIGLAEAKGAMKLDTDTSLRVENAWHKAAASRQRRGDNLPQLIPESDSVTSFWFPEDSGLCKGGTLPKHMSVEFGISPKHKIVSIGNSEGGRVPTLIGTYHA